MKIAVVNAVTGRFDNLKVLPRQSVQHDFQFFSDKNVPEEYTHLNKRQQALYFKSQCLTTVPGYDLYIWIDGKIHINEPDFISQVVAAIGDGELAILKHGERTCVYEELEYIIDKTEKQHPYFVSRFQYRLFELKRQYRAFQTYNYPVYNKLHDCSIMAWRPTETTVAAQASWWNAIKGHDVFDQTEIHFVAWVLGLEIKPIVLRPGTFNLVKHGK